MKKVKKFKNILGVFNSDFDSRHFQTQRAVTKQKAFYFAINCIKSTESRQKEINTFEYSSGKNFN